MLPLTFANKADYALVSADCIVDLVGLDRLAPGSEVVLNVHHPDGSQHQVPLKHTLSKAQLEWLQAGSALNYIANQAKA